MSQNFLKLQQLTLLNDEPHNSQGQFNTSSIFQQTNIEQNDSQIQLPSFIQNLQKSMKTSQTQTQQINTQKQQIESVYSNIKQNFILQNQKIHEIELQIEELEKLRKYSTEFIQLQEALQQNTDLNNFKAQFVHSIDFYILLQSVFEQKVFRANKIQKQINQMLNNTSFIQQLYNDLNQSCLIFQQSSLRQYFMHENDLTTQLSKNQFHDDYIEEGSVNTNKQENTNQKKQQVSLYKLIPYYIEKLNGLLNIRSEVGLPEILQEIMQHQKIFNDFNFDLSKEILSILNDFYSLFIYRYIKLIREQYSIIFMQSQCYTQEQQLAPAQCAKMYFKFLVKHLNTIFEQLQLDKLFFSSNKQTLLGYNYSVQLNNQLLVNETVNKKPHKSFTTVPIINSVFGFISQKYQETIVEHYTSCKQPDIKAVFAREYFKTGDNYNIDQFQQQIVDFVVQTVYKFFEQIVVILGWKWVDVRNKMLDDILLVLEGQRCLARDLLIQIVDLVIRKMLQLEQDQQIEQQK